jgi:hypothetical protein
VAALIVGVLIVAGGSDDKKPAAAGSSSASTSSGPPTEIFLEPAKSSGRDPFTKNLAIGLPGKKKPASSSSSSSTTPPGGTPGVPTKIGTEPGLYGGTRDQSTCDKKAMIDFLEANPDKGNAWAEVQGIEPTEVGSYIDTLTPVYLDGDTRVTNHGFANGVATPHQSVLEDRTAVLVDNTGMPRARCACGNPLLPPQPTQQTFTGDAWPEFDQNNLQVVQPGPPTDTLIIRDVETNALIARPIGTNGTDDSDADAGSSSSSSQPTSGDVTSLGSVSASSVFPGGKFPASLAVDGDDTTSWFSGGSNADGADSTYTWELPGPGQMTFDSITIKGNGNNAMQNARQNFGFESVTIAVVDLSGIATFEQTIDLPGTPDPTVTVSPGEVGHEIVLTFHGHEDPTCGGFSELEVSGHPS